MQRSGPLISRIGYSKALHVVVFVIAMISFTLNGANARAANLVPTDYRIATASKKFEDTSNGGLSSTNPGLDMIGLNIAFNLSD